MAHLKVWVKIAIGLIAIAILIWVESIDPVAVLMVAVLIMMSISFAVKFLASFPKSVEKPEVFLGASEVGGYGEGRLP